MAWEHRPSGWYYYRAKRVAGRVVREYMGTWWSGVVASEEDEQRRRTLEARRRREARARATNDAVSGDLDACLSRLREEAAQVLRSLGFHNHKGEWRRRR